MSRLLLINQSVGHLFADVVSAAVVAGHHVTLFSAEIKSQVPSSVKKYRGCRYLRNSIWQRLGTWLLFSVQLLWHLFWYGHRYDKLLIVSNPPFAPLLACFARRSYALVLYDLYPQVLRDLGYVDHTNLLYRLWWAINGKVLRGATKVFTLSERMAVELRDYYSNVTSFEASVDIIPPWADPSVVFQVPWADNPFVEEHQLEDSFVVLYSGNMGVTHPLEDIVEAARLLVSQQHFKFFFIGDGPKRAALEKQAYGLNNIHFLLSLPLSQLKFALSAATVSVVALDVNASGASVPSKTYSALAAGTPLLVLSGADAEVSILAEKQAVGICVRPGNPAALARAILDLSENQEKLTRMKGRALSLSKKYTPINATVMIKSWLCEPKQRM